MEREEKELMERLQRSQASRILPGGELIRAALQSQNPLLKLPSTWNLIQKLPLSLLLASVQISAALFAVKEREARIHQFKATL